MKEGHEILTYWLMRDPTKPDAYLCRYEDGRFWIGPRREAMVLAHPQAPARAEALRLCPSAVRVCVRVHRRKIEART